MNTQFIKIRKERAKQAKLMARKDAFKFRLNALLLTGNLPAKHWTK